MAIDYRPEDIKVLKGIEAVRLRPGMYIGSTGKSGLHHLLYEIIDNSMDEVMAGACDKIKVVLHEDGSAEVEDNGRGIPIEVHPETGKSTLETVMTVLHAGGKFSNSAYKVSGGLHGVGASVVNALSEVMEVWVRRNRKVYYQKYSRGEPLCEVKELGETSERGTIVRFKPDPEIFSTTEFDPDIIENRLRELAFLNPGLTIEFEDRINDYKTKMNYVGGIKEYVSYVVKHPT